MNKKLSTKLIHTGDGQYYKKVGQSASVPEVLPVYMNSVFAFDDTESVEDIYESRAEGYIYSRIKHPNSDAVSSILAEADEGERALVFSSGMSAIIISILSFVKAGDHVISSPVLYGGVHSFLSAELPRFGIEVTFTEMTEENIKNAIKPNTKIIYTETICNPLMEVPDLKLIGNIAHENNILFFIDNTFATPVIAKPLLLGADAVLYSATKYLGGHSDIVGGAVTGRKEIIDKIEPKLTLYGATLAPMETWLLARSLRTLDLRVKKHSTNALTIAEYLEKHPKVESVFYPGLPSSPYYEKASEQFSQNLYGGMLSVNLKGGEKAAVEFIDSLNMIKYVPSLAGTATTVSYAPQTSHRAYSARELEKVGISLGQVRISAGIEDAEDIISELERTLEKIK